MRYTNSVNRLIPLFTLLFTVSLFAEVTVRHLPGDSRASLPSFESEGGVWVSVSHLASELECTWRWSFFSQKLTVSKGSQRVVFFNDGAFYRFGDQVVQMPVAPRRKGGNVYLPQNLLVAIFRKTMFGGTIEWLDGSRELLIQSPGKRVDSVTSIRRDDATEVSISLSDSAGFAFSYLHPRLTITISNTSVDPEVLDIRAGGIIDSILALEHETSAEIVLFLNKRVEKPQLQYVNSNQLQFSLETEKEPEKRPPVLAEMDIPELRRVVIDPGHGGRDPGAVGPGGTLEKDVVLAIGLALREQLKARGFEVLMTRDKDVFIPLRERTQFANEKKADLFISIHANAIGGPWARRDTIRGYKSYFLSQARNEHERLTAMRENAVIELEDKPQQYDLLQSVLVDLAGNEFLRQSQEFCIIIDQVFSNGSLSNRIPKLHLGVGQANFWVLNGAYMPSVLFEVGFISNPQEEQLLNCSDVQNEIAQGLTEAVVTFKHQFEIGI